VKVAINDPHADDHPEFTAHPTGGILEEKDIREIARGHWRPRTSPCSRMRFIPDSSLKGTFSIMSIDDWKDRTIMLDGFSKTYAMTGGAWAMACMRA